MPRDAGKEGRHRNEDEGNERHRRPGEPSAPPASRAAPTDQAITIESSANATAKIRIQRCRIAVENSSRAITPIAVTD